MENEKIMKIWVVWVIRIEIVLLKKDRENRGVPTCAPQIQQFLSPTLSS